MMIRKGNVAHRIAVSAFVVPAFVLVVLAASGAAHAAEPPAIGPQSADSGVGFTIGQMYSDPLLEAAGSLNDALGFATGFEPAVVITMSKSTYVSGEKIQATEFTMKNPNTSAVTVEVKVWLTIPGQSTLSILNLGADGSLSFAANFNSAIGPLTFFTNDGSLPKGTWSLNSRVLNPTTGEKYSEDLNEFVVQ